MAENPFGITFNVLPEIAAALPEIVSQAVREAAFDIQAFAMQNHPWNNDTGFLQNSIYVCMKNTSTYGQGVDAVPPGAELLPEVDRPQDTTTAHVAVGANYGVYLEFGTRNMPPYPYLLPAFEAVAPQFATVMENLEALLRGGIAFPGGAGGEE